MNNFELFISLASAVLSLLITAITFIAKFLKSKKARKAAESILEICNQLMTVIGRAEKLVNYTGEEKKQYAMTLMRQYALDNNLSFDSQAVSDKIDELVALAKQVNSTKRATPTATSNAAATVVNRIL